MRTLKKSSIVFILLAGMVTNALAGVEKIVIKTKIYCDHCSVCEDCKPRIEKGLKYIKGVKYSKLNVEEQTIYVEYNKKKTSPEQLRKDIALLGIAADELEPDATAYSKLDGCCKKK